MKLAALRAQVVTIRNSHFSAGGHAGPFCAILCCLLLAYPAGAQVTAVWQNNANGQGIECPPYDGNADWSWPSNDSWSQQQVFGPWPCDNHYSAMIAPSNWSTACYPNNGNCEQSYDVIITGAAPTHLDVSAAINSLTVQPGGYLNLFDSRSLNITTASVLSNEGVIFINPQECCGETRLDLSANILLQGGGTVVMHGSNSAGQITTPAGGKLTQAAGHTIRGRGYLSATLDNAGVVNADWAGQVLSLFGGSKSNTGTLEATGGAILDFGGFALTQTGGGIILADASTVRFWGDVTVTGGTLGAINGGLIANTGGRNTFTDVTLTGGNWNINQGTAITLHGSALTNNGTIHLDPQECCDATLIDVDSNLALKGSGTLDMRGSDGSGQLRTSDGVRLTNTATHVIVGRGFIPAALDNAGLINANWAGQYLSLHTNGKTNAGIIEASNNGIIRISGITLSQSPTGQFLGDGGTLLLNNGATIAGGKLASANSGVIWNEAGENTLRDITLPAGTDLRINQATKLHLVGTTFFNDGLITADLQECCEPTQLIFDDNLTFSGQGRIFLKGVAGALQLATAPGKRIAHPATHTINGRGDITAALDNQGLVNADWSGQLMSLDGNDKTNAGTIEATNGGIIRISGITLSQSPTGQFLADGGTLLLHNGAIIAGGTLASANSGVIWNESGENTLSNITLPTGTDLRINQATTLHVVGISFFNDGLITADLQECCEPTLLTFDDDLTLNGQGRIFLKGTAGALKLATAPGKQIAQSATHTINGRGDITAVLNNRGLVNADWSGQLMSLDGNDKTNAGIIEATNGGIIRIAGITLSQSPTGQFLADGGTLLLNSGATIAGGKLASTNGGAIWNEAGENTLRNITLPAGTDLRINQTTTLHVAGTSFINDGLITADLQECCEPTRLIVDDDLTLNGQGRIFLKGVAGPLQFATAPGKRVKHAAGHIISGRGEITAAMDNQGLVTADWNGQAMVLDTNSKTNIGLLNATGGGTMAINGITLDNTGGRIVADGGTISLGGSTNIVGGKFEQTGGPAFWSTNATLTDVTLMPNVVFYIPINTATTLTGTAITNNGTILVNPQECCERTALEIPADLTLGGQGEVIIRGTGGSGQIHVADGAVLTVGPGQLIHGRGEINGALVNGGSIVADWGGQYLVVNAPMLGLINSGMIGARNGAILVVNGLITDTGAIDAGTGSSVSLSTGLFQTAGTTTVNGTLSVGGSNYELTGGTLIGTGTVNANVLNTGGIVSPGGARKFGTLSINGTYTQAPNGTLRIDITGPDAGRSDRLQVSGAVNLAGMLTVTTPGFIPKPGTEFIIVAGSSITGAFAPAILPTGLQLVQTDTQIKLVATTVCGASHAKADFNGDCAVDQADITLFNACLSGPAIHFASGCAEKDLDKDGDVDQADFAVVQLCYSGVGMADASCQ